MIITNDIKNLKSYIAQIREELDYLTSTFKVGSIRREGIDLKMKNIFDAIDNIENSLKEKPVITTKKEIKINVVEKPKVGRPKRGG